MIKGEMIVTSELRPCVVTGQKALFHCWEQYKKIIPPSALRGGHNGGEVGALLGIIEREDGTIHKAYPEEIRFIDLKVNNYFHENATALDFENQITEQAKGCEYCNSTKALYQETRNTKLYINTIGEKRELFTEVDANCPPFNECCVKNNKIKSAFIINYCPNCGRKL